MRIILEAQLIDHNLSQLTNSIWEDEGGRYYDHLQDGQIVLIATSVQALRDYVKKAGVALL